MAYYEKIDKNQFSSKAQQVLRMEMLQCTCLPQSGCPDNCLNRHVFFECDETTCPCGTNCTNNAVQNGGIIPIELFLTEDKGWGVKATSTIKSGSFILEYVGAVIQERHLENLMSSRYADDEHHYSLSVGSGFVINARDMGNESRFINHSCDPNCEVQKWLINGLPSMALFAIHDIMPNEELTFDYKFQTYNISENKPCLCKSNKCRKSFGKVGFN